MANQTFRFFDDDTIETLPAPPDGDEDEGTEPVSVPKNSDTSALMRELFDRSA